MQKKKIVLLITSILIHSIVFCNPTTQSEYYITIHKTNPFKVTIKTKLDITADTLFINPVCPSYDYPQGWSTFINPLSEGLTFIGNSTWKASNNREIAYEVDLSFVKEKWEAGNEQAGTYIDSSIFVVTRALFLTSDIDEQFKVTFNLPEGYTISTPWTQIGENIYQVNSLEDLTNNTLVWGRFNPETVCLENFKLELALLGYGQNIHEIVGKTFQAILKKYLGIFPTTPESNYLITVFPSEQNDGEAYATSNAFTLNSPPTIQNKVIWANQFAHELFHYWNGRMINGPERSKRQWFSEGFTEYFANLSLVQTGIISEDQFYRLTEKTIGLYFYFRNSQYPEVSLLVAGSDKSKYRFGVYNGGWCTAFVMDMMIREKYPDKSLQNFMNVLFTKYGLNDEEYIYEDLKREFNDFINIPNNDFFEKYISGIDVLPVERYLNKMGIILDYTSYEGTAFLFNNPKSSKDQLMIKDQWLK